MNLLRTCLFLPLIHALVIVQIHQDAFYQPLSPCAFIRNASWTTETSLQSCIWKCVHEHECQTAVYFNHERNCSMFTEFYNVGSILPSAGVKASVICYQKNRITSTATSTGATIFTNPCSFNGSPNDRLWNTTGITVLNSSQLTGVSGLYMDSNDTLYIVDEVAHNVVWKLPKNASTATLVAGELNGPGANASQLHNPQGVYLDSSGNLYVTDYYNFRVQKYAHGSMNGETIAGVSGSSGTAPNQFGGVRYMTFDDRERYMYVTDCDNHRIIRYQTNPACENSSVVSAGGYGAGNTMIQLNYPWGIDYLPLVRKDLYITNYWGHSVIRWKPGDSSGVFVAGTPGTPGSNATCLNKPMGIKIDSYLNMYVVDNENHRVQMFCQNNQIGFTVAGTGMPGSDATHLNTPRGITFDSSMNMYISDFDNYRVQKFLKL